MRTTTMWKWIALAAAVGCVINGNPVRAQDDEEICGVAKCYINGGSRGCNRASTKCPPCLYKKTTFLINVKYHCYDLDPFGNCPEDTTFCAAPGDKSSDSSSSGAREPTVKPTTAPPAKSDSSSDSGSQEATAKPTKAPVTKKPTVKPTEKPTEEPTEKPTPKPNVTQAAQATEAPINSQNGSSDSKSSMPMIIGIIGGAVVVVAAIIFFIWKRRQDDDDDSDDDEYRYNPPKPAAGYNNQPGRGPSPPKTLAYNNEFAPTSPSGANNNMRNYAVAGGVAAGAGAGAKYGAGVAGIDYGSPSTIDGSNRAMYTSDLDTARAGYKHQESGGLAQSVDSTDGRDVWGNRVGASYREKRTDSNVSVEF